MEMITDNNVNLNNYQDTNNLEMEMNFSNVGWADGEYVIYRDKHAKDVHVQISASWMEKIKKLNHDEQSMNQGTEEVPAQKEEAPTYIPDENIVVGEEEDGGDEE